MAAVRFVLHALPTLAVLAAAGALGWYGHHTGWAVPKFSALRGDVPAKEDWCDEHNVPESLCVECDDALMPRPTARGVCEPHGVAECVTCNPDLAQLRSPPTVTDADRERARRALAFAPRPANNPGCRLHLRRIQFATAADADKAGVMVEPAWTGRAVEAVAAAGEVGYDRTRVAHLSARSPGTVWRVFKRLGDPVAAGDVLALVDAADVGRAKAEVMLAAGAVRAKAEALAALREVSPAARVREAEATVREAEIRLAAGCQALTNLGLPLDEAEARAATSEALKAKLHLLGLPPSLAKELEGKAATTNLLPVVAPTAGTIISHDVVAGEVVDSVRILFEVADTRALWITLEVKAEDAGRIAVGQPVRFKPDGPGKELAAAVTWRSPQADPKTRTVKVRADLGDPDGALVANTFGAGRVILRDEPKVVSLPSAAVFWEGCCHVVFVRDRDYLASDKKVFHVRKVRVGARDGTSTEIIAGLLPGEPVVTRGGGLLLSELLRDSLGEGCACHSKK